MRRREPVVDQGDGPPVELTRYRYADWADETERAPVHWRDVREWPTWHHIRAWRRYLDARRRWCAEHGRDYVATFHPEWSGWTNRAPYDR